MKYEINNKKKERKKNLGRKTQDKTNRITKKKNTMTKYYEEEENIQANANYDKQNKDEKR